MHFKNKETNSIEVCYEKIHSRFFFQKVPERFLYVRFSPLAVLSLKSPKNGQRKSLKNYETANLLMFNACWFSDM